MNTRANTLRRIVDRSQISPAAMEICRALVSRGYGAWIVGGSVRDHLMGRPVGDWDLCTSATPEQVMRVFPRVVPTGVQHGTVSVLFDRARFEVTTLRGESTYSDGRRPDEVYFVDDIVRDLARRDFTVNAIAYDPLADVTHDPFDGLGDLERRLIRAVGRASERFGEDGLRILRAARFVATLEFALEDATRAAIKGSLDTFRKVSAERVRDEWLKTLDAREPSRAFDVMATTGILEATHSDLAAMVGCPHVNDPGHDVWTHSLRAMDNAPRGNLVVRMAAFLHDVGRPGDPANAEAHGERSQRIAGAFLRSYRFSNQERDAIVHLVAHHEFGRLDTVSDADLRRFLQRIGIDVVPDWFLLAFANATARRVPTDEGERLHRFRARVDAQLGAKVALSLRDLAIGGADLQKDLGIPPSRRIGEILAMLLEVVVEDPAKNDRTTLLELARAEAQRTGPQAS